MPEIAITHKRCAKCHKVKSVTEFSQKAQQPSGFNTRCRDCIREDSAIYYANHRDALVTNCRERYRVDPDLWKANAKSWREAHRDRIRENSRLAAHRRRITNPEKYRQYGRLAYAANAPMLRERRRQWHADHPEQEKQTRLRWYLAHKDYFISRNAKRRALKREVTVESFTRQGIYERDGGRCHVCSRKVDPKHWHLDHLIPLSRGGSHNRINVAVSCSVCNMRRYNNGVAQLRIL